IKTKLGFVGFNGGDYYLPLLANLPANLRDGRVDPRLQNFCGDEFGNEIPRACEHQNNCDDGKRFTRANATIEEMFERGHKQFSSPDNFPASGRLRAAARRHW